MSERTRRRVFRAIVADSIGGTALIAVVIASALPPATQALVLFAMVPIAFVAAYVWKERAAG